MIKSRKLIADIIIKDENGRELCRTWADESAQMIDGENGIIKHEFLLHFSVDEIRNDKGGKHEL